MSRSYYRVFLTLKQERADFTKTGREAFGRCVIEARGREGRVSCQVQDLMPETQYKLFIVAADGNESKVVCVGRVLVDYKGKGETRFAFDADDVMNTGASIEKFNVAAIAVSREGFDSGNLHEMATPLVGYKDDICINWKINTPEIQKEIPIEIKLEIPQPDIMQVHENFAEMVKKYNEETDALSEENPETKQEPMSVVPKFYSSDIDLVFTGNTRMFPFARQKSDIFWVRTSPSELPTFPLDYIKYMHHEFVKGAYGKYKHLIIGRTQIDGKTRYILGVPDVYSPELNKDAEELGFHQFKTCSGGLMAGEHGYWLLVLGNDV